MRSETKRFNRFNRFATFLTLAFPIWLMASSFSVVPVSKPKPTPTGIAHFRQGVSGWAQNYTGIRYRYAGQSPQTGFDCSGFTRYILKEFNINVSSCSSTQSRQGKRVALKDVQPGDLVFFGRGGRIQHVAMVVENTPEGIVCVHSTCSRGVIVENIHKSSYWRPRILFARDVISDQAPEQFSAETAVQEWATGAMTEDGEPL